MAHLLIWGKAAEVLASTRSGARSEEVHTLASLVASLDNKGPTLVLADPAYLEAAGPELETWLQREGRRQVVLLAVTDPGDGDAALERFPYIDDVVSRPVTPRRLERKLERAFERIQHGRMIAQYKTTLDRRSAELQSLNAIGVALSAERDIEKLLEMILTKSREITGADAGSLYLVERAEENEETGEDRLRFKLAQNDSVPIPFKETLLPLDDNSMAGYAALHNEPVRVADAYQLPPDEPYQFGREYDERSGYRTKSVLAVAMQNHRGQVIGVVQLINKKRDSSTLLQPVSTVEEEVISFTPVDVDLVGSLASQAAVAYQNADLIKKIRELFEEFVTASVTAIEKRDPTTSGHSRRVAVLTVGLAEKVDRIPTGPLADVHFTRDQMEELRYASLLHDFGKVAVPEKVLKKGKKLLGSHLTSIEFRFICRLRALEAAHLRQRLEALESGRTSADELKVLDAKYEKQRVELEGLLATVKMANTPRVVDDEEPEVFDANVAVLKDVAVRDFPTLDQELQCSVESWSNGPLLSRRERDALLIPRGSLTEIERTNELWGINSHVQHTYEFLQKIRWTGEFRRIPEIAWKHHEKLDGSGYPQGLVGPEQIPVQSRMMTISDIFDALVAWDRPYKPAKSPERALEILNCDKEAGRLDRDLLEVFLEACLWEKAEEYREILKRNRSDE
jgi:HD-GYP domain-containing protein (c-di-GMP phosphodiesterase class II)